MKLSRCKARGCFCRTWRALCDRCERERRLAARRRRGLCRYTGTCREDCSSGCVLERLEAASQLEAAQ